MSVRSASPWKPSATAVGGSFWAVTWIVTVAVDAAAGQSPDVDSAIPYVKVVSPLKFGFGVKVNEPSGATPVPSDPARPVTVHAATHVVWPGLSFSRSPGIGTTRAVSSGVEYA